MTTIPYSSDLFESEYFVMEPGNWHLLPGAPEELVKKLEGIIKLGEVMLGE